jgi:hypothetical protein
MRSLILPLLAIFTSGCLAQRHIPVAPAPGKQIFSSAEFGIEWPPGYHLVTDDGIDSRVRVWRDGGNEISADWGPSDAIGWNPIKRWDGAVGWQRVDTLLGGRPAQLATYRLQPNLYALDVVWPDLGEHKWGGLMVTAALWVHVYAGSATERDTVLHALGTVEFR